jgi:hypothetical protein
MDEPHVGALTPLLLNEDIPTVDPYLQGLISSAQPGLGDPLNLDPSPYSALLCHMSAGMTSTTQ